MKTDDMEANSYEEGIDHSQERSSREVQVLQRNPDSPESSRSSRELQVLGLSNEPRLKNGLQMTRFRYEYPPRKATVAPKRENIVEQEIRLQLEREAELAALRESVLIASTNQPTFDRYHVTYRLSNHDRCDVGASSPSPISDTNRSETNLPSGFKNTATSPVEEIIGGQGECNIRGHSTASNVLRSHASLNLATKPTQVTAVRQVNHKRVSSLEGPPHPEYINRDRNSRCPVVESGFKPATERYHPLDETPIQKDVRLVREREEALREARGLQRPSSPGKTPVAVSHLTIDISESSSGVRLDKFCGTDGVIKKLANTKLMNEIEREHQREMEFQASRRNTGTSYPGNQDTPRTAEIQQKRLEASPDQNRTTDVPNYDRESRATQNKSILTEISSRRTAPPQTSQTSFSYHQESTRSRIEKEQLNSLQREEEIRKQRWSETNGK